MAWPTASRTRPHGLCLLNAQPGMRPGCFCQCGTTCQVYHIVFGDDGVLVPAVVRGCGQTVSLAGRANRQMATSNDPAFRQLCRAHGTNRGTWCGSLDAAGQGRASGCQPSTKRAQRAVLSETSYTGCGCFQGATLSGAAWCKRCWPQAS